MEVRVNQSLIQRWPAPWALRPLIPADAVLLCSAHHDSGFVTMVSTFDYSGLELLRDDGTWMPVPCRKGAVVVNIGDMLATISGGKWKATNHRVIDHGVDRWELWGCLLSSSIFRPKPGLVLAQSSRYREDLCICRYTKYRLLEVLAKTDSLHCTNKFKVGNWCDNRSENKGTLSFFNPCLRKLWKINFLSHWLNYIGSDFFARIVEKKTTCVSLSPGFRCLSSWSRATLPTCQCVCRALKSRSPPRSATAPGPSPRWSTTSTSSRTSLTPSLWSRSEYS